MNVNPRAAGFNYGMGWGSDPKPAIYYQSELIAWRLRQELQALSAKAWGLDHALRAVRLAETDIEKRMAIARLSREVEKHEPACVQAAE